MKNFIFILFRAMVITVGLGVGLLGVMTGWENVQAPGSLNIVILTGSSLALVIGGVLLWVGLWYMKEDQG